MHAARWRFALVAEALLAAAPGIGSAQDSRDTDSHPRLTELGEYVLVGGGVTDFTKAAVKDRFGVGGTWDLRVGVGSRYYLGAEVAYVGSARGANGSGSDLLSNGGEGILRVQYPYQVARDWLVEPFVFGGIGWSRISLRNAAPGVKDSDDIGVVPFGGGITVGYRRLLFDARFTYRTSFNEDLPLAPSEGPANMEQWAAGASVGFEF